MGGLVIAADLAPLAVPVDELTLLPGNPRVGDVDAIARSLAAFGQRKPVVANRDGTVIAGNHTLLAARQLGWDTVAAVWVDDDATTAHAYALADNRTAELGSYDDAALAALIAEVHGADAELLAATGWSGDDLQDLLDRLAPEPGPLATDPDDVPEQAPAITAKGDVWRLGEHRLVCGDSSVPADVERLMGDDVADMVWTDPPYGVAYVGGYSHAYTPKERLAMGGMTIANDELDLGQLRVFLRSTLGGPVLAACRHGAAWFVASPEGPRFRAYAEVLDDLGIWRQTLAWVKDSLVMGRTDYHYRHESLIYGWVPGAAHTAPPDRTGDSVWEVPRPKQSERHPTMKPVALVTRAIENHTTRRGLILDPFAGSGTTIIAAQVTGRRAAAVEVDPHYCDVICKRFEQATGVVPVRAGREQSFVDG